MWDRIQAKLTRAARYSCNLCNDKAIEFFDPTRYRSGIAEDIFFLF